MKKIVCPNCGAEYFPQEIFIMSCFNEHKIVKDETGKILNTLEVDTNESYKCDYCNKTFYVKMDIDFTIKDTKFEEHVTKLHKPALFLKED